MEIPLEFSYVAISTTAGGTQELVAAAAGKTPRLHGVVVGTTAACAITFSSTAAVAGPLPIAARVGLSIPFVPQVEGSLPGTLAKNLSISSTASVLSGWAFVSSSTY